MTDVMEKILNQNPNYNRLPQEEKNMVIRFVNTLSSDKEFNLKVTNFILSQLNNDSINRSVINEKMYAHMVKPSVSALFRMIVVDRMDTHSPIENYKTYVSAKNFLKLLYTRVLFGRDREIEIEKIRASHQPATPTGSLIR